MSGKTDSKNIVPKFIPNAEQTSKRVYSNFVSVRSTGLDYTISFCDVIPPTKEQVEKANKGEEIPVPLQCEVVVPNELIPALINALKQQYDAFQEGVKKSSPKENMARAASTKKS